MNTYVKSTSANCFVRLLLDFSIVTPFAIQYSFAFTSTVFHNLRNLWHFTPIAAINVSAFFMKFGKILIQVSTMTLVFFLKV